MVVRPPRSQSHMRAADMAIGVKDKAEDLQAYFAEAESWDRDRFVVAVRSPRVAWTVAIVALVFASICAAAVLALSPLKPVVPYVVTVHHSTGATERSEGGRVGTGRGGTGRYRGHPV